MAEDAPKKSGIKAEAEEAPKKSGGIKESKWAGEPNYECPKCAHASLDKAEMERHVREGHPQRLGNTPPSAAG